MRIWRGNLQDYEVPETVDAATHWRKDGMPDNRFKNEVFHEWINSIAITLPDGRVIL